MVGTAPTHRCRTRRTMTNPPPNTTPPAASGGKGNPLLRVMRLTGISVAVIAPLAIVHALTAPRIAAAGAEHERRAIAALVVDAIGIAAHPGAEDWWLVQRPGGVTAWIAPWQTNGYAGPIQLRLAFDRERLLSVAVTAHSETPGLGDFFAASGSNWLDQFKALPTARSEDARLRNGASSPGTVDGVTGATITSKAIADGIADALAALPTRAAAQSQLDSAAAPGASAASRAPDQ